MRGKALVRYRKREFAVWFLWEGNFREEEAGNRNLNEDVEQGQTHLL